MPSPIVNFLQLPCVIHNRAPSGADEYGDVVTTETPVDALCWLEQDMRAEEADNVEVERWRLYLDGTAAVAAGDFIEVLGDTFEVIGPPWYVRHPLLPSEVDHVELTMERRR